jgi:DNA-binding NtrC family response regulator
MLFINDDRAILKSFKGIFERKLHLFSTVESGKESKEKLGKQDYDRGFG